jgi:uncharacterized protein (UPF0335 family)
MATKEDIKRFVEDYLRIENEKQLLAEDLKELFEDMKERTDIKALKAALRIAKIKAKLGDAEAEMETILDVLDDQNIE